MSEEDLQNLPEPKETELIAESIELLEEGEQSQWMQKHSNDIQEENTSLAHSDCTTEGNVSMESTTDSIEAVSNALVSSTDTLLPQEAESAPAVRNRAPCKYGDQCYRVNPAHKEEFSHPGDRDFVASQENNNDDKPECEYGTSCYRQNPQHKRDFKHTQPPAPAAAPTRQKRRRRKSNQEDESDNDNDYDLDDSFIDDDEDEEDDESEADDEDYVPDSTEMSKELSKEEAWKPAVDDAPEVLELLEEAKNYLRNKKL